MATFSRTPQTRALDRSARLQTMLDMPFSLGKNLAEQAQQGVMDSFGLGSAVRDFAIPAGNTEREPSLIDRAVGVVPLVGQIGQVYDMARDGVNATREQQPSMSEDEYKASPYFRTDIPFDPGMTEDRAASLAAFYDQKKVREHFGSKRPISTFIGQMAGQAIDPINYVPIFGQAAEAAAVARLGTIAGRLMVGSADAAINTAAFGVMSAGLREEFGDDVSWQAMTNEIAMSALIGGVFSGVAPLVRGAWNATAGRSARAAEAKVANELLDIRSLKESRAVLNEAVGTLAETGDVNLSPNSAAIAERVTTEVTGRAATVRALDTQTANLNANEAVAITPSGQRVNVRPEVVDASTLVRATGDLQVRNRSTAASNMQIEDIAINLDPARLMPSVDADSGAPIVGTDNIIDSGNGRVQAIVRASQAYPARYGAYRKALEDAGYDLTGIETPVLINRRTTELSRDARALFNQEANAPRAAQMSATELGAMDANALADTLDALDPSPITSAGNRAFVQRFMGNLSPSARGALVDANGNINADGVRRIENALVASAYGDVDAAVLRRFAEATDDNTRAIVGAMSDVAGKWAQMRQSIKRGDISPEFDMTPELTEALRRIGQWREQAKKESRPVSVVIKEGMAQIDMLSGVISPEAQVMIGAFYQSNSFARAAGRETIADLLTRIVDATEELGRTQLFETADVGKLELLRNAASNEQGNLFTPIGTVDGIEADGSLYRPVAAAADSQGGRPGDESGRAGVVSSQFNAETIAASKPDGVVFERDGIVVTKRGSDFRAEIDGQRAGDMALSWRGAYPTSVEVGEGFRRKRVATALYDAAEKVLGRRMIPSPLYTSPEAMRLWNRRFSEMETSEVHSLMAESLALADEAGVGKTARERSAAQWDKFGFDPDAANSAAARVEAAAQPVPSVGSPVVLRDLPDAQQKAVQNDFLKTQPARSLDELYAVVEGHQTELGKVGAELGEKHGAEWRNPGIKKQATSAEKMARKRYDSTSRLTDVVRGGYVVKTPDQVDSIVADLAKTYPIVDEGWRMTSEAYFDRKVMVQFPDGTIGEVQFWHPDLLNAKDGRGHALYEEMRALPDGDPRYDDLRYEQRQVYLEAIDKASDEWLPVVDQLLTELSGRPASGNMASNASALRGAPDDITSSTRTDSQAPASDTMAQANRPSTTAGRPSQSKNSTADTPVPARVGTSSLLVNDTPADAAARVGKPDDIKQIALSHGVDPTTGDFVEMSDVAQIREEGRLSKEDEAELAAADEAFENAQAWGRALDAAVSCIL